MKLNPPQHNTERSTPHKRTRGVYALQTEAGIKRPCLFTYNPLCSSLDSHHFLIQLQRQAAEKAVSQRNSLKWNFLASYWIMWHGNWWTKVCDVKVWQVYFRAQFCQLIKCGWEWGNLYLMHRGLCVYFPNTWYLAWSSKNDHLDLYWKEIKSTDSQQALAATATARKWLPPSETHGTRKSTGNTFL